MAMQPVLLKKIGKWLKEKKMKKGNKK